ncbi:DNA-protecting protein DprA [Acetobacter lambici]|uniref:DNA-processing protein DprA n=1 Tax=Acetobacter lambici TaxID=1332824 RepID=A0ABT1EWW2_9PROT|nr:DNA-processing protein DprA [Acetobacter lambici]MCP1241956.1 DNA-processing protein DprA [Acetobacter lambici]MCP1257425.1 DNA-processing protein DprA [Acetobacter lambici]NHO56435.1 DNA-protecting protein DprA [Acetobacter lambici]
MNNLFAALRLARTEHVGPRTWQRLVAQYGTPAAALDALPGLPTRGRTRPAIPPADSIQREIDATLALGGQFLTLLDGNYPPLLRHIPDAPPVLSILGNPACLCQPGIGIVGARNASAQGLRLAESLATELADSGLTIISGLARGIDSAAHKGALYKQGLTLAAIAGGLDCPYPPQNAALQDQIAQMGAVVTEAPLGTAPQGRHFPRRNRLIAGLALGCVVVEAAPHSGTLITARMAADYGREVFAVPGSPLDPRCRGSNDLLRKGAILTERAADILPHIAFTTPQNPALGLSRTKSMPDLFASLPPSATTSEDESIFKNNTQKQLVTDNPPTLSADQNTHISPATQLLDLLSFTPVAVDDLIRRCQFSASVVLAALTQLELSGQVTTYQDGRVGLTNGQAETSR